MTGSIIYVLMHIYFLRGTIYKLIDQGVTFTVRGRRVH